MNCIARYEEVNGVGASLKWISTWGASCASGGAELQQHEHSLSYLWLRVVGDAINPLKPQCSAHKTAPVCPPPPPPQRRLHPLLLLMLPMIMMMMMVESHFTGRIILFRPLSVT